MKICFVQPESDFQVRKHSHALALTFPQLILNLQLQDHEYLIYIYNKSRNSLNEYIIKNQITHVFITSITSTFPYAVNVANLSKSLDCIVVLGGIFSSINYDIITRYFHCFDYIITGHPDIKLLPLIEKKPKSSQIIHFDNCSNYQDNLGDIICNEKFRNIYNQNDTACYELTNGCPYNCIFCSMRRAFKEHQIKTRPTDIAKADLLKISKYWNKLKLIDDDIALSLQVLKSLDLSCFSQVIAETRIDRINKDTIDIIAKSGITHLIIGVESFDKTFLYKSNKTTTPNLWMDSVQRALELCLRNGIIARPVIMLTTPTTTIESLCELPKQISDWKSSNGIETLFTFYTPHPYYEDKIELDHILTYDLKLYDHLNLVWLPPLIRPNEIPIIMEINRELVNMTETLEYNPPIKISYDKETIYSVFFNLKESV